MASDYHGFDFRAAADFLVANVHGLVPSVDAADPTQDVLAYNSLVFGLFVRLQKDARFGIRLALTQLSKIEHLLKMI